MPSASVGLAHPHGFALTLLLAALFLSPSTATAATALAELIASLETTERYDSDKAAAVYREAVLGGTGIDRTVARLRAYSRRAGLSPDSRSACHLAIAHFMWRDGAIEAAVVAANDALHDSLDPGALLLKARLLDAGGDADQARHWYQRAAEAFGPSDEQWLIRVRLAMMDMSSRNVAALEELALQREPGFRNQAAVVLALLGRPDRAITLYQPLKTNGKAYPRHVRLSEWALQAGSHELAREQAWLGYAAAPVRTDRLYALGLLTESYRSAGELHQLIEDLAARESDDEDLLRLRVEALIETEEYHRAIALYEELSQTDADIDERHRLVALHEAAGDAEAMVREYRRMMDAEPAEVRWYDALAAHYLHLADDDAALAVWKTLEVRNGERAGVLVEGARLMRSMDFVDKGVAMIERHIEAQGPDVGALLFVFETWLDRGEDPSALDALVRLEAFLPEDAAERIELADAYGRLSRPEEAVRVFEAIRDVRGELGFDDQVRLAWLYARVDRRRDALTLWRDIWVGMETPARRSLAESQMLPLAAELGTLGDLAVELEEMLMSGTARRNHMNLLVRIYTEAGDSLSATEIIDEYAPALGEDEIGHQRLLAHVHMLLKDYPAHDKALRRLYEIDPANRVEHIKSILINLLTLDLAANSDERFEEIQRWMHERRQFDRGAVTGEFEAGVLSMAGFADQAVAAYRRAVVEQPENDDNLLLLAEAMAGNGQADTALATLQFFAENAVEDNDFVVAVDGILNLLGTTGFSRKPNTEALDTLEWTRRIILERIAGRAGKFYLYELLADIAREKGDAEASFLALENSLAEAGLRRPAVLRELVTMATPNAGFGGFSTGRGDIDRQLKYGRRLVGLREQLPPEVYIDVGASLLANGDVPGAERAFEMIDDITGMIDIDRTKAEIFEVTGYGEQSRVFYNRALNVNRDSLELLHKTGFLYETTGREDVAFRRYLRAIRVVLGRQPTVLPSVYPNSRRPAPEGRNATVSREYRDHFDSLEQGLLLSWPKDAGEAQAAASELKALFETELATVIHRSDDGLLPLARYARLDRTARLIRRVGFFLGDDDLAAHADVRLLVHFGGDGDLVEHLRKAYGAAGRLLPDGVSVPARNGNQGSSNRQPGRADEQDDFETRLKRLRLAGATDEIERLLGERIRDGRFLEGLGYGLRFLEAAKLDRLARLASSKLTADPDALIALLLRDAGLFLRVEEAVGRPLIPPQEVIALLLKPHAGGEPLDGFGHNGKTGHWRYLEKRGTTDEKIRYLRVEAERSLRGERSERLGTVGAFRALVRGELTARQRTEVTDTIIERLSGLRGIYDDGVRYDVLAVLPLDAHPSNSGALYRIAAFAESRWPEFSSAEPLLRAVYEGRPPQVFQRLSELGYGLPEHPFPYPGYTHRDLRVALAVPRSQMLEEIAAGRQVDPRLAVAAFEMEFPERRFGKPTRADSELHAPLLERVCQLDPDNDLPLARLIEAWLNLGYAARAEEAIAGAYRASPDRDYWRLAYFQLLRSQQRFQEAVAVAADGGLDYRDTRVYQSELAARTSDLPAPFDRLLRQLVDLGDRRPPAPQSPTSDRWTTQGLVEALGAGEPEQGRQALRKAWRKLLLPLKSSGHSTPGNMSLQLTASPLLSARLPCNPRAEVPAEPRTLFDAVAESPYGAQELDGYLRAMPDEIRKGFHRLYGHLARATTDGQRRKELTSRLRGQKIDDHEFTLWMLLRESQPGPFVAGEREAFEQRLSSMADPSPFQLVLTARVFAAGGAVDRAEERYRLVAARMIRHGEYAESEDAPRGGFLYESDIAGLLELAGEVAARLPEAAARGIVEDILSLARRADDVPGADAWFDVLVLALVDLVYGPQELLEHLGRRYPQVLAMPTELAGVGAAKAVELVRAYARAGEDGHAIKILGALLKGSASRTEPYDDPSGAPDAVTAALDNLETLYGIDTLTRTNGYNLVVLAGVEAVLARQERLFPASAPDWPRVSQWTGAARQALLGWLQDGQVDQTSVLELLTALGQRAVQIGDADHARDLLTRTIAGVESSGVPLGSRGVAGLASWAEDTGSSLPLKLVADVLKKDGLAWRDRVSLVGMFEDSEEIDAMLKLARDHGIDHGLAMLRRLHTMAESAGNTAYAGDLAARIRHEEAAQEQLD
ncbi:MAG: hypothetical protein F4089_07355 [Gammaproteobacteria bacterium]|nr:hypothetical protein [Gammaproteobacteria bacterium]